VTSRKIKMWDRNGKWSSQIL